MERGGREMWRAALVRMVYDGTQYDIHIHIHRLKRQGVRKTVKKLSTQMGSECIEEGMECIKHKEVLNCFNIDDNILSNTYYCYEPTYNITMFTKYNIRTLLRNTPG